MWTTRRNARSSLSPLVSAGSCCANPFCSRGWFSLPTALKRIWWSTSSRNWLLSQALSPGMRGFVEGESFLFFVWEDTRRKSMQKRVWASDLERDRSTTNSLGCFGEASTSDGRRSHVEQRCSSAGSCRSNKGGGDESSSSVLQRLHRLLLAFVLCSTHLLLVPAGDGF